MEERSKMSKITRRKFSNPAPWPPAPRCPHAAALPGDEQAYAAATAATDQVGATNPRLGPNGIPVLAGVPDPVYANTTLYQVQPGEFLTAASSSWPDPGCGLLDTPTRSKRHWGAHHCPAG